MQARLPACPPLLIASCLKGYKFDSRLSIVTHGKQFVPMPILNAEMYHKEAELDKAQRKLVDTRDDLYEETQGSFYLQI